MELMGSLNMRYKGEITARCIGKDRKECILVLKRAIFQHIKWRVDNLIDQINAKGQ